MQIQSETPQEFIRERVGRGGKSVKNVEGGYVIAKLNSIYGQLNWDFEVLTEKETDKEVFVKGRLTIKDHAKGYSIGKTQYGQADKQVNVPIGDTYKAAGTDALKKCASLFGIALDVYWTQLDNVSKIEAKQIKDKKDVAQATYDRSVLFIQDSEDIQMLQEAKKRLGENKIFSVDQRIKLGKLINEKIKKINNKNA